MKKLILSVTALAACSVGAYAQGTVTFDGSSNVNPSSTAASSGMVFINGVLDTGTDINAELLYSATQGGTYSPVVTLLLSSSNVPTTPTLGQIASATSDITFDANGTLLDTSGQTYQFPTIASGTTVFFEVEAWATGNSYGAAGAGPEATTAPFAGVLSGQNPPYLNIIGMPALNLVTAAVPEPSTLAMAGVGLASMLLMRRKVS
jgi:hypothetical protein